MSEVNTTFFQIKPRYYSANLDLWTYNNTVVMYMNEVFDLDNVRHVTAVTMRAPQHYTFEISLCTTQGNIEKLQYEFSTKATALKAQRELARAMTSTGEFEVEQVQSDAGSNRRVGVSGTDGSDEA